MRQTLQTMFDQEAKCVRRQIAALRTAESDTFLVGQMKYLGDENLTIVVAPATDGSTLVAVGEGRVPPLAQDLACGVSRAQELVTVARTGGSGLLAVTLEPGEYSLRFVNEVRDEADAIILRRLGDRLAKEQLLAAGEIADTRPQVQPRSAASERPDMWVAEREVSYGLSSHHDEKLRTPAVQKLDSLNWNAFDEIELLYRAELVPFGFVLLELLEGSESGRNLGHQIVALPKFQSGDEPYRAAATSFKHLADKAGRDAKIRCTPATEENSPLFRQYLTEIQELQKDLVVARDKSLLCDIQTLCSRLEQLTQE